MSEKIKNYTLIFCVVVILILSFFLWSLLRKDVSNDGGTADDVRNAIDNARQEQQNALDGIGRIESGITTSEGLVGKLEEGNRSAQATIDRIEQSHKLLEESIERNEERISRCEELIRDSESRVGECQQVLQTVRKANE